MNKRPIEQASDPDLRFSHAALQRAAQRAQDLAKATGTMIVVSRNGIVQHLVPERVTTQPQHRQED